MAPSTGNLGLPAMYTLIHERYRNLPAEAAKNMTVFETQTYFHVEDVISNYLKKRIVISLNIMGMQAWTLNVEMKDTPQGVVITPELIIGIAPRGYDPLDPTKGTAPEMAKMINDK